jgi:hypothetical protein
MPYTEITGSKPASNNQNNEKPKPTLTAII